MKSMKKIIVFVLCVLLMGSLAVPALAADPTVMTITASKSEAYRGDEINFTVSISSTLAWNSAGFIKTGGPSATTFYDETRYEYVKGRATSAAVLALDDLDIVGSGSFDKEGGTFIFNTFEVITTPVSVDMWTFTLKVKGDAPLGSAPVVGKAAVKTGGTFILDNIPITANINILDDPATTTTTSATTASATTASGTTASATTASGTTASATTASATTASATTASATTVSGTTATPTTTVAIGGAEDAPTTGENSIYVGTGIVLLLAAAGISIQLMRSKTKEETTK